MPVQPGLCAYGCPFGKMGWPQGGGITGSLSRAMAGMA